MTNGNWVIEYSCPDKIYQIFSWDLKLRLHDRGANILPPCSRECTRLTKHTRSKKACSHSHKTDQKLNRSCPNFWTWETPGFSKLYPTSVRTDRYRRGCPTESENRAQLRGVLASLSHYPHKEHLLDGFGLDMIFLKIFSFRSVSAAASHDSNCWARLGAAAVTPSTGSTLLSTIVCIQ